MFKGVLTGAEFALRSIIATAMVACVITAASPASATTLNGSTVTVTGLYPDNNPLNSPGNIFGSTGSATVGAGVEFPAPAMLGRPWSFDISDTQIIFTPNEIASYSSALFNGFEFTFSGAAPITGVTIAGASNFGPNGISFDATHIFLNYQGMQPDLSSISIVNVQSTPLPAALPLFASGLGALGVLSWRRKRKAAAPLAAA
jgi:hypothetical protein